MTHKIFAAALFALCAMPVFAQNHTLSGYVRESASGEPLAGATVAAGNNANATSTNVAGFYSMRLPAGMHQISVSFTGYTKDTLRLNLRSDTTLHFSLAESFAMLGEVVVTAGNELVSVKDGGRIGVNIHQVRNAPSLMGEPDIIKYLQLMPGVSSGREGSSQLAVRGGSGDQTLMMLDDIPVFNQNHAFGLVSIFNSDALSGSELYKSHIPARYGGRLSSVASMRMRDGDRSEHRQSLTLGTLSLGGLAEGPLNHGKGSYIVSARRFTPDLLLRGFYAIRKSQSWKILYSFYDVNAKVSYSLGDNSRVYASFYNGRDSFSNKSIESDSRGKTAEAGLGFGWGNTSASLRLETRASGNMFINTSAYFTGLGNKLNSYYNNIIGEESVSSTVNSQMYETGLRSAFEQKAGMRHSLTYGLHALYQFFAPQTTSYVKNGTATEKDFTTNSIYTGSIFFEDRINMNRFTLEAGLRASLFRNNSTSLWGIEPRLSVNMQTGEYGKTHLSYARSLQPLISIVKPYLGFPLDFWIPYRGNVISSSNQIAAGWSSTRLRNLTLTAEGYYKWLKDLSMIFAPDDFLMDEAAPTPASGHAYGVELMAAYARQKLSITGSYTWSRSMRTVDSVTFPFMYDVPHSFNLYATYNTVRSATKNHTLSININAHSGLPYTMSEGTYIAGNLLLEDNPLFPNTRLKPYFRSDISYSMERAKRKGSRVWQFSILNFTGHQNPYIVYKLGTKYEYSTLIPIMPSFSYKRTF
ncbi:MAG: TonB-dependent receptor [Bacteroidales bacterium]|jgi:hypothetical protein|nr:TonB-dependent receptor [Bacteroidales bacterium]